MCVSTCQVSNGGNSFFITTVAKDPTEPPPVDPVTVATQDAFAATYSSVGTTFLDPNGEPILLHASTISFSSPVLMIPTELKLIATVVVR